MITWDLASGWTLELARAPAGASDARAMPDELTASPVVPASVPGCVHTDLMAAGLIPDPLVERNETLVQWIGECDWRYRCRFTVPAALSAMERVALHCEGLDTVATLSLNGVAIGRAENMHRPHRFDVTGALRAGENELAIEFRSPLAYAREQAERLGERPRAYPLPYNFVRKMACNFGWDWGPTLVTAGVWKPVRLEGWEAARIRQVRPWVRVTMDPGGDTERALHGSVEVHVDLERGRTPSELHLQARLTGRDGDPVAILSEANVCAHDEVVALALEVPSPRLWWPAGYGEQPLYTLSVMLQRGTGENAEVLDGRQLVLGFRDVALDTAADAGGAGFAFVVNGRRIFAKGADWIPDDPFPARVDDVRLRRRLGQAVDAGMNMLRVWGGGLYESDAFYDVCDALGLLVWQDFAFACAAYPEEEPFASEVEAEARANVVRLAPHPSLALWNGNNECLWQHDDNHWEDRLGGLSWGRGFYLQRLPRLAASLDPTRPYWAGSPWSGREDLHPNLDGYGCKHIWDAWNERDYEAYRDKRPRFVAEFGYQSGPTWATLTGAISDRPLAPDSPGMLHHQKQESGNAKLEARLAERFRVPADFDAWLFAGQLNQARALEAGVRHFRALAPHCMGTLVWQLNDCWPVTSWSAIDAGGRPKPSWFALRRAYAPVLLSMEPGDGGLALVLHNDSDRSWHGAVRVRRLAFDGTELAAVTLEVMAEPRSPAVWLTLPAELATPADPAGELVIADAEGLRALHFFAPDKDLRYPPPELSTDLGEDAAAGAANGAHRYRLVVHAHSLLRDLCVFPDRLHPDATVDGALVTLLPGESHTFTIASPAPLTRAALSAPPVLASANALVKSPQTA
jgi:beta-mannosidase